MPKSSGKAAAGSPVGVSKILPFRVGPWVSYEPPSSSTTTTTSSFSVMNTDVDMEAPQISTLRDRDTPPPQKTNNRGFKLKLVVKDQTKTISSSSARRSYGGDEEEAAEEEDDQEDQLIDDDDGPIPAASLNLKRKAGAVSLPSSAGPSKRKVRKSDNNGKKTEHGQTTKLKEKPIHQAGAPDLAPTMTWFQANPAHTEHLDNSGNEGHISLTQDDLDSPLVLPVTSSKKTAAAKKEKAPKKPKATPKLKLLPPMLPPEDTVSEAGMTGTAASSPAALHPDEDSPEPEQMNFPSNIHLDGGPESVSTTTQAPEPPINLEGVPIPVYPLPTKPFPVLPPPKVSTGFAPNIPLDRSKAKVRHWRVANREIRGIGGGRWFTRAWVGEKESDLANVLQAAKAANANAGAGSGLEGPGGGGSISGVKASAGPGKGKKKKGTDTANGSRSGSSVPEINGTSVSARGPSKMRISQMAPEPQATPPAPSSEAGDQGDIDMLISSTI